VQSGSEIYIC